MKLWKLIIPFFIVIIFLISIQLNNPDIIGPFKGIVGDIVNPVIYYGDKLNSFTKDIYKNYVELVDVKKKYEKEVIEKKTLFYKNLLLQERLSELERLKKLLSYKELYNLNAIACNVIGRDVNGFIKYILIDRGNKDNVEINDAIISYDGLVGKVIEVYNNSSRVITVANSNNNVSIMNFKTRTVGIMHGDGLGGLIADYYIKTDNVTVGDILITSGLGKIYPKGIPVGTVEKVEVNPNSLFRRIWINSLVDFHKLENVLIVKLDKK
jgi:rod shape-determining protein MreC